jgi:hypothetical protein
VDRCARCESAGQRIDAGATGVPGVRSALIIFNNRYQDPGLRRLRAPGQDAEALARVLSDPAIGAFEVKTVANKPEHWLRREVAAFFADRARGDLLLLYLSCHAVKDNSGHLPHVDVGHAAPRQDW